LTTQFDIAGFPCLRNLLFFGGCRYSAQQSPVK
jgi:hypothetical protein